MPSSLLARRSACAIELFGGVRVRRGSQDIVRFRTSKAALLLAYLALHRGNVSRDVLSTLLWPDVTPDKARNSLSVALNSLRNQAEGDGAARNHILYSDYHTIGLTDVVETDIQRFRSLLEKARHHTGEQARILLEEACHLYSGMVLEGYYDDWVLPYQAEYADLYAAARQRLLSLTETVTAATPPAAEELATATATVPDAPSLAPLPRALTRFYGRERELAMLAEWVTGSLSRLVTLTGLGGVGKTRLALELARQLQEQGWRTGFVSLAAATPSEQLQPILAQGLGVESTQLMSVLQGAEPFLLVLDNVEHLAGTPLLESLNDLLNRAPRVVCVATSRVALELPGEEEVPVGPLPVPSPEQYIRMDLETLLQNWAGIALFVDRARQRLPAFRMSRSNARDIVAIVQRLEGIPLAIELAAARMSVFSTERLRRALEESAISVLHTTRFEKRHQSLERVLDWSVALLPESLRQCVLQLSVLRGIWTEADAIAVTGQATIIDGLERLIGASLIEAIYDEEGVRFRMRELVREYAASRIPAEERDSLLCAHAEHFRAVLVAARELVLAGRGVEGIARQVAAYPNIVAALEWSLTPRTSADKVRAVVMATKLASLLRVQGLSTLAIGYLKTALANAEGEPDVTPDMCLSAGRMLAANLLVIGAYDEAEQFYKEDLAAQRDANNARNIIACLGNLALIHERRREFDAAFECFREVMTLVDPSDTALYFPTWLGWGVCLLNMGETQQAIDVLADFIGRLRDANDQDTLCLAQQYLARAYLVKGDLYNSVRLLQESLDVALENRSYSCVASVLTYFALILYREGQIDDSVSLMDTCQLYYQAISLPQSYYVQEEMERLEMILPKTTDRTLSRYEWNEEIARLANGARPMMESLIQHLGNATPTFSTAKSLPQI